jgi:hypothetical protein
MHSSASFLKSMGGSQLQTLCSWLETVSEGDLKGPISRTFSYTYVYIQTQTFVFMYERQCLFMYELVIDRRYLSLWAFEPATI